MSFPVIKAPLFTSFKLTVALALISTTISLGAQSPQQIPAQDLARKVVETEIGPSDRKQDNWSYMKTVEKPGRTEERLVIETSQGEVDRLIAVNGKPLTSEQNEKEQARIRNLAQDPSRQDKLRESNQGDSRHIDRIMKLFPDALVFSYGARHGHSVQLLFKPNPEFHPHSREAHILNSLAGEMWVDEQGTQIEEAKGRLMRDVRFGGGLAGHVAKGGHFEVRKIEAAPGDWKISFLEIQMRGKALLFKDISVQQTETHTHFHRVANALTLAQAATMLSQSNVIARMEQ